MKRAAASRGFTLIELLVVITIIGVLSAVVLASLNTARGKARDARRLSDISELRTALQTYFVDNGTYPGYGCSSVVTGSNGEAYGLGTASIYNMNPQFVGTYMSSVPADPVYGASGRQGNYIYITNGSAGSITSVQICTIMEARPGNITPYMPCGSSVNYNYCISF